MKKITELLMLFMLAFSWTMQTKAQTLTASNYEWKNAVMGGGGFVTGIAFSEVQQDLIYSRTDVGGAFRWDAASQTWIQLLNWVGAGQKNLADVESVAPDPTNAQRVYVVGGESNITRVMRSTDQGQTFTLITPPFTVSGNGSGRSKGERLVIDPNSTNILFYASRSQGLFKSTDYGSTWSSVSSLPVTTTPDGTGINFIIFDKASSTPGNATSVIYAGISRQGNSLYRSTNGGSSWQLISGTPGNLQPIEAGLGTNGILYISYCDATGPNGISSGAVWKYNTTNGQWTNINPPTGQGGFGGLSVDKNNPNNVMVGTVNRWAGDQVYRSSNGGTSWRAIDANASRVAPDGPYMYGSGSSITSAGNWIFNLRIDPFNSNRVMYVTGAGIWACSNVTNNDNNQTTNWNFLVKGIEEMGAYDIISPPSGAPMLSVVGDVGGFRHTSLTSVPSTFFQPPGWGTGTGLDFAQNNPNIVVRSYWGGADGAYSNNNGQSWTAFPSSPSTAGNHGDKITISPNGSNIVWAVENDLPWRSTNNGSSWTRSTGIPGWYYSLKSDRVNSNKFYAYHNPSGYMYVSTNGGASFTQAGFVQTGGWYRIATNPWVEGDIWVPMWDGLYHSTNSGSSFTKLSNVQEAVSVTLGKPAPGSSIATLFVQAKINNVWGYYASVDNGASWSRINSDQFQYGYPGGSFLVADQSTYGRVYFSTHCMGITYGQLKTNTNVAVTGVTLSPTNASVASGATLQLTATVAPSNATNKTVSWNSSNTSLATVSTNGLVTGVAAGTATITVTTQDGGKTATSAITVTTGGGSGLASGRYRVLARHSGKALDVNGYSTADGGNVIQWTYGGGQNQQWDVLALGNDEYRVTAVHSGKGLDVTAASAADGANVQQYTYSGGANQRFKIESAGSGYYRIVAVHSNKCVEVTANSTADGANVQQYTCSGSNNQQWSFVNPATARIIMDIQVEAEISKINVYPNPSQGSFSVEYPKGLGKVDIKIYDSRGRLVLEKKTITGKADFNNHLAPGIYTIKINNNKSLSGKRIIINQ